MEIERCLGMSELQDKVTDFMEMKFHGKLDAALDIVDTQTEHGSLCRRCQLINAWNHFDKRQVHHSS